MNNSVARLRWLFAAQTGLTLMPLAAALLPPLSDTLIPLAWTLFGLSIEPPMLLAFGCVFHESSKSKKLLAFSLGAIYFSLIFTGYRLVQHFVFRGPLILEASWLLSFVEHFARTALFLAGLCGFFLAFRFSQGNLQLQRSEFHESNSKPTQFSLQQLFLVTLLASIFLCLARAYRYPWESSIFSGRDWIGSLLLVFALGVNAMLASWATLGDGFVRQRSCFVLILALLVGLAYCAASVLEPKTVKSWLIYTSLMVELPTAVLLGTFLVLRASGYRLTSRSS